MEGTLEKPRNALGARFVMTDGTRQLPVTFGRETPDTLVDGAEVVVEGSLGPDGVFVAHTLLAKCPSKYEASNRPEDYKGPDGPRPAAGQGASGAAPR